MWVRHGYHESLETPFPHTTVVLLVRDEGSRGGCVWEWAFEDLHLSLYVRVESTFYTHRKTMRLKALIGNDAFWVPPRLWAYAAGHQPDGCFKDYSAEEIAMLICYPGDAKAMLEALLQAGFMDGQPLRVHDWHEYNGVLDFFSKRAKKAAEARWEKERSKEKDQIRSKQSRSEASIASSIPPSPPVVRGPIPKERIEAIHSWYSEQMGGDVKLDFAAERTWYEWFNAGHVEDDFKRVVKHVRDGINTGERNRGALKLSNLLQPDKFGEDLLISKQALPARGQNNGKPPTKSIAEKDLDRMIQ